MSLVGFDDLYRFADSLPLPVSVVAAGGAIHVCRHCRWPSNAVGGTRPDGPEEIRSSAAETPRSTWRVSALLMPRTRNGLGGCRGHGRAGPKSLDERANRHSRTDEGRSRPRDRPAHESLDLSGRAHGNPPRWPPIPPLGYRHHRPADVEQKADILRSLVEVATILREPGSADLPRIAAMAASEKVSEAMPDTVDAAELAAARGW